MSTVVKPKRNGQIKRERPKLAKEASGGVGTSGPVWHDWPDCGQACVGPDGAPCDRCLIFHTEENAPVPSLAEAYRAQREADKPKCGQCGRCDPQMNPRSKVKPRKKGPEAGPKKRTEANEGNKEASFPSLPAVSKSHVQSGATFLCPFTELARNRFNPRENFDRAELDELGGKLKRDGQVQAVLVRRAPIGSESLRSIGDVIPAKWEIVAGERRALAAFHAGLPGVRAEVIEHCDDARACELAIAENRDRKDISQVEYARGLEKLADLKGLDPKGLAADQDLSEQHVRNLLRLLKTPAEWQQLVIEGKIDGTHLRDAAPYLHVASIAGDLLKAVKKEEEPFSVSEFSELIEEKVRKHAHRLECSIHTPDYSKRTTIRLDKKHPRWAELDVVTLKTRWGKTQLALNEKLAEELLDQAEKEWKAKAAKKSDRKDAKAAGREAKLTPAERKKLAAEKARKHEQRLDHWFHDWLRVLCAAGVAPADGINVPIDVRREDGAQWLIAYALWARPGNEWRERELAAELSQGSRHDGDLALSFLEPLNGLQAAELMHAYAPRLLVDADGAPRGPTSGQNPTISDDVVLVLARDVLGLDLLGAWRVDRRSPLREKFWALHSKDQLAELGSELGLFVDEQLKKSQAVDVLLAVERPLAVPRELAKLFAAAQPAKAKTTKAAKRKPR